MENEKLITICTCSSPEHQAIFSYDEEYEEVYLHTHLIASKSFFGRLLTGIRHIFGYTSQYGDWDELILTESDTIKLRDFLVNKTTPKVDVVTEPAKPLISGDKIAQIIQGVQRQSKNAE